MDQADIRASLSGDGQAYARLIGRHQDAVAARMRRFGRDRLTRQELVHDVFVEAYFSLRSYQATAPFSHWLNRIATRVGYRYWNRQARLPKPVSLEDWDAAGPDAQARADAGREAAERLHRVLDRLPPRDRLVVTLLYLEERTLAEAADLTGWTKTMVKVQAFRARGKLRRLLEEDGDRHQGSGGKDPS